MIMLSQKTLRRQARKIRDSVLTPTSEAVSRFRIRHGRGSMPILVYQVGKVGSSSIYYSMVAAGIPCLHTHRIAPENIARIAAQRRAAGLSPKDERISLAIHDRLQRGSEKVRIITMVREPVSRNISAFFQNLGDFYGDRPLDSISPDEAIRRFLHDYPHDVTLDWFDVEFAKVTGISVYDYPFPHEQRWSTIESGRFEILVLQAEASDSAKKEALRRFLGREIQLVRSNTAADKEYAALYKEFRKQIHLPASYVDRMLDSRYARHFYGSAELEKFRAFWLRRDEE